MTDFAQEVGYPPAVMGESVKNILSVLAGAPVPCVTEINSQIAVTEGDNTPSVDTKLRITDLVGMDGPPDMLVTGGMGKGCDPKIYTVDYPK